MSTFLDDSVTSIKPLIKQNFELGFIKIIKMSGVAKYTLWYKAGLD